MAELDLLDIPRHDLYRIGGRAGARHFTLMYIHSSGLRYAVHTPVYAMWWKSPSPVKRGFSFLSRLMVTGMRYRYGFQISPRTKIGAGFYISHVGVIMIHHLAILGANVSIHPGVVIGQTNRGELRGTPIIGDRVWIGSNAVAVGAITVGDGARLAPGACVNRDVPENAVVIGNPGKIVSFKGSDGNVNHVLPEASSS